MLLNTFLLSKDVLQIDFGWVIIPFDESSFYSFFEPNFINWKVLLSLFLTILIHLVRVLILLLLSTAATIFFEDFQVVFGSWETMHVFIHLVSQKQSLFAKERLGFYNLEWFN